MTQFETILRKAAAHLVDAERGFALIGGLAVSVRTEPRFTRDVDLAVAVANDQDAEALVRQFLSGGYAVAAAIEQNAAGRLSTVRLSPVGSTVSAVLDLLFASSGIEREVVMDAEIIEILPSLSLPVAQTGHLIALKLLSRDDRTRPQDLIDLRALLTHVSQAELNRARAAIALITERGYHRGRNLSVGLDDLLNS